ncbi:mucin-3A-like [Malaya genurostris]|uniref:mucin-3A-like n=1 Tax=Malaya genurostris TaxID=325434 RepID=UPI0026F407E0|nr:mucin-3A-like [Malaya genurostris]
MRKWLLLACAVVAFSSVCGDLGLKIGIPSLSASVKSSIGNGISIITAANASFTVNATLDSSGAVAALRLVVADFVLPLGSLLTGIQSATTNTSGYTADVITTLDGLVTTASTALGTAMTDAATLATTTRPAWYSSLTTGLTNLSTLVSSLTSVFDAIGILLTTISSATYAYTPSNVTKVITSTVVGTITTPLTYIAGNLTSIGSAITAIGKDKQTTVILVAAANATITKDSNALAVVSTAFNKSATDLQSAIIALSATSLAAINTSYSTILARSALYNGGVATNLTTFLYGNLAVNSTAMATVVSSTQNTTSTVYATLSTEMSNVATALIAGLANITNVTSTSSSKYASMCQAKYGSLYKQPDLSLSRLAPCLQLETAGFNTLLQAVGTQFNALVSAVGVSALRLNLCTVTNGNCSVSYFADFPSFTDRATAVYTIITTLVSVSETVLTGRASNCLVAVSNDIQDNSQLTQNQFGACLTTGT